MNSVKLFDRKIADRWNTLICNLEGAHLLQTWEWAAHKAVYGWECFPTVWVQESGEIACYPLEESPQGEIVAALMLLRRRLKLGPVTLPLSVLYASKGPLLRTWTDSKLVEKVLTDLDRLGRNLGGIFLKIDPDVELAVGAPDLTIEISNATGELVQKRMQQRGWHSSPEQIQFRNTVILDLLHDEADLLAAMKQKTRYNIRLAERKGVEVRVATTEDLSELYQMYAETAHRDGFVIRHPAYYLDLWQLAMETGLAEPLIATVSGRAVAGVVIFRFAGKAWYLHGMSRDLHREKMPNYLLQWEAIRRAKAAGCHTYDLWGAPDDFSEADPLWGVFRFKLGLGGIPVRYLGAWDLTIQPTLYNLYAIALPRLLEWMRRQRRKKTRKEASQG